MPRQYHFITIWKFESSLEPIWDAIYEADHWPKWWKAVKKVKTIRENNSHGIHGIKEYTWGTAAFYSLCFRMELTEKKGHTLLAGVADGELQGTGVWHFREENGITTVQYNWDVHTTKKWMNSLSWLLKPVFQWNHDLVMKWGAEGIAKKLGVRLIEY